MKKMNLMINSNVQLFGSSSKKSVFLVLLTVFSFSNCTKDILKPIGSGSVIKETRSVANFTEVDMTNAANIEFIKGTTQKVEVSDYENLLQFLIVEVSGNKLIIKTKGNTSVSNSKAKVFITTPELITKTIISGSGNINFKDAIKSLKIVELIGSGNITSNTVANYTELSFMVSGSGNIVIKGKASNENAVVSGTGNINLAELEVQNADVNVSGAGNVTVKAIKKLKATISGTGNICYTGSPELTTNISGIGKLTKK